MTLSPIAFFSDNSQVHQLQYLPSPEFYFQILSDLIIMLQTQYVKKAMLFPFHRGIIIPLMRGFREEKATGIREDL
jgi:hypothetical protein